MSWLRGCHPILGLPCPAAAFAIVFVFVGGSVDVTVLVVLFQRPVANTEEHAFLVAPDIGADEDLLAVLPADAYYVRVDHVLVGIVAFVAFALTAPFGRIAGLVQPQPAPLTDCDAVLALSENERPEPRMSSG